MCFPGPGCLSVVDEILICVCVYIHMACRKALLEIIVQLDLGRIFNDSPVFSIVVHVFLLSILFSNT